MNPQTVYGADVISRCEYAVSDPESRLTSSIQSAIAALAEEHIRALGIDSSDIFFAVLAGNTCMEHLLLGVSPDSLLHAPYLATIDQLICVPAASLTLPCQIGAQAAVLPCIAGFVGGDTIAVLLSLPQQTFDSLTLVLDIGTNGELILGKGDQLYTCSTAAGPAFEGARISCGMRGAPGAIDHVSVEDGKLKLHRHCRPNRSARAVGRQSGDCVYQDGRQHAPRLPRRCCALRYSRSQHEHGGLSALGGVLGVHERYL